MITIIDYHAGNIGSIQNMLKKIGVQSLITADPDKINSASKIILPGVGSFDFGISKLRELGVLDVLNKKKAEKTPILGICLGAQLMCQKSEEGELPGLSWIEADVIRFPNLVDGRKYTVPHIGWDIVKPIKQSHLFDGSPESSRFYFVHSFYIQCKNPKDSLCNNLYGVPFQSAFESDNIIGVQFHPEKSHKFGKQLLKNFTEKF